MGSDSFGGLSEWDASLPRKRMAASVLLFDDLGRVLLVEPTYKPHWDLPGGAVELGESPLEAGRREVKEELGLDVVPRRLVAVDWVPPRPERSEGLITVFDGGVLASEQAAGIALPPEELRSCAFLDPGGARRLLSPLLARRVEACMAALAAAGGPVYLENGVPVS